MDTNSDVMSLLKLMDLTYLVSFNSSYYSILDSTRKLILSGGNLDQKHRFLIQSVLDRSLEKINIGHYSDVPEEYRHIITIASFLKVIMLLSVYKESSDYQEIFYVIDFGLIFGSPLKCVPNLLQQCAQIIENRFPGKSHIAENTEKGKDKIINCSDEGGKDLGELVDVLDCPSIELFSTQYFFNKKPVKMKNCMNHWPALKLWSDTQYILSKIGKRTVPVEIGSKYTDPLWTQKLMTVEQFVKGFLNETAKEKGYLAQYQLFHQIPELLKDIHQPDYCCVSEEESDEVDINAWFGPKGTVSPLHYDPKHNLLSQVVGIKKIILFSPEDSPHLYCYDNHILSNTAEVDPRKPDLIKFPDFQKARAYYCLLEPGQILYIPPKWWHFVESLSVSFSVSFWWR